MPSAHILIIAPDPDLSRSLRFALGAEDLSVTWRASIGADPTPGQYDCTILDHHALGPDLDAAGKFLAAFRPVVLLANGPHRLSSQVFRTILKPHLGGPLIDAVREAIAQEGVSTK